MENILILKQVDNIGLSTTVHAAINALTVGGLIAIGDQKVLIGADTAAAPLLANVSMVQFFTKVSTNTIRCSVPIPRADINRYIYQQAVAGVNKITRLGGTTAGTTLVVPSEGDTEIVLKNLSYNHAIASTRISTSFTKKPAETVAVFLQRVVDTINAQNALLAAPFVTAALVNASPNFAINLTTAPGVDLAIGISGFLEGSLRTVTQDEVSPIGAATDILAMEKDMSRHQGNHGYAENNDLWYKQPTETNLATTYDVATLVWKGISPTPTNSMQVAANTLQLAVDSNLDGGTMAMDAFLRIIANVASTEVIENTVEATDNTPE